MAGSYTWARGYEDTYGSNDGYSTLPNIDQRRDIQEHVLVASYQLELPAASPLFGGNKAVRWALDNWRITGISTFGTGGRGNIGTVGYSPSFEFTGGGEQCVQIVVNLTASGGGRSWWFNTTR
jgi:hypothetical protein